MGKDKRKDWAIAILGILVLVGFILCLWKGGWRLTLLSLNQSAHLFEKVAFRLLLGFLLGGFIQVLIPKTLISKWLGAESGLKGILIGSYVGAFGAGGPYVWMPVVASIYRAGADIGPIISLLTSRLIRVQMLLVWHIPFFGVKLSLARYLPCLLIPPLVGVIGRFVFRFFGLLEVGHVRGLDHRPCGTGEDGE